MKKFLSILLAALMVVSVFAFASCTNQNDNNDVVDNQNVEGGCLFGTGAELFNYDNALDATVAMQSGKIDAVVIDELPAKSIVAVNEGLKTIELVYIDGSNTEEEYALCVAKGNTELLDAANKVITALAEEGKIEEFLINHTSKSAVTE